MSDFFASGRAKNAEDRLEPQGVLEKEKTFTQSLPKILLSVAHCGLPSYKTIFGGF